VGRRRAGQDSKRAAADDDSDSDHDDAHEKGDRPSRFPDNVRH
jgi:hypothetical protein